MSFPIIRRPAVVRCLPTSAFLRAALSAAALPLAAAATARADGFTVYNFDNSLSGSYRDAAGNLRTDTAGRIAYQQHFGVKSAYMVYHLRYNYTNQTLYDGSGALVANPNAIYESTKAEIASAARWQASHPGAPVAFDTEFSDPAGSGITNADTYKVSDPSKIITPTLACYDHFKSLGGTAQLGSYAEAPQNTYGKGSGYASVNPSYQPIADAGTFLQPSLYNYDGQSDPTATGSNGSTWEQSAAYAIQQAQNYGSTNTDGSHRDILPALAIAMGWSGPQQILTAGQVHDRLAYLRSIGADGAMFISSYDLQDATTGQKPLMDRDSGWFSGVVQFQKEAGNYVARTWNSSNSTWDNMATRAWNGNDGLFMNGDDVVFDDSGTGGGGTRVVNLNSAVAPASVTFNNATSTYQITGTGSIADSAQGPTTVTLSGSGSVAIATANTYTGGTILKAGTLLVGNATALGTGAVTLNGGTLSTTDAAGCTLANAITLGGTAAIAGGSATTLTFAGSLGGSGTLHLYGNLALSGTDSLAGGSNVQIHAGADVQLAEAAASFANADMGLLGTLRLGAGAGTYTLGALDATVSSGSGNTGVISADSGNCTLALGGLNLDTAYNGTLADGGGTLALVKNGNGTQTLSGAATYSGTTTVSSGTLAFTGASTTLAGAVSVAQGATLRIGDGTNAASFATGSDMSNAGTLNILSSGTFTPAHNIAGSGQVNNSGTMTVGNRVAIANAVVNASGSTFNAAGASATTGNLVFRSGSVFQVDGDTRITASSATVQSGAKIVAATTGFVAGTQVAVLTTTGALSASAQDTFDTTLSAGAPPHMRWVSSSDSNHVYMGLQWATLAPQAAGTQQAGLAAALDTSAAGRNVDPDIQDAYARLSGMTPAGQAAALQRAAGGSAQVVPTTWRPQMRRTTDMLQASHTMLTGGAAEDLIANAGDGGLDMARASALSGVPAAQDDGDGDLRFFAYAEHDDGSKPMAGGMPGDSDLSTTSFTVGAHRRLGDSWSVGAAFGYDESSASAAGGLGDLKVKDYGLNLYASHTFDNEKRLFASALAGFNYAAYDSTRQAFSGAATGSTGGTNLVAALEGGYKFDMWEGGSVTPVVGATWMHGEVKGYQESLPAAPGMALAYGDRKVDQYEVMAGAELAQKFDMDGGVAVTPLVRALWHHQLGNTGDQTLATHFAGDPTTQFTTFEQSPTKDAFEADLGVGADLGHAWRAFIQARWWQEVGSGAGHQIGFGGGVSCSF